MGRDDRRLLVVALCGIALALAVALVVGHIEPQGSLARWSSSVARLYWPHLWHLLRSPGRKGWAIIVQFVGAAVTFGGLLAAYIRARYGLTVKALAQRLWRFIRRLWAKLSGIPQHVDVQLGGAHLVLSGDTVAIGQVTIKLDTSLPVQEQIELLAQFVNNRSREAAQIESMIVELRRDLAQARQHRIGSRF